MAKNQKITPEELQQDEVAQEFEKALVWFRTNWPKLLLGLLLIIGVILLIVKMGSTQEKKMAESTAMMNEALGQYQRLEYISDTAERQKLKDTIVATVDNLRSQYSGSELVDDAVYLLGATYYQLGQFSDAQKAYNEYLSLAKDDEARARGEIALGYAAENESFWLKDKAKQLENLNAALNHFTKATSYATKGSHLYYYALLGVARINELTGKDEEAIKLYEQVKKERPATTTADGDKAADEKADPMMDFFSKQITDAEKAMSYAATADMRLQRLKAKAGLTAAPVETLPDDATSTATTAAKLPAAATEAATTGTLTNNAPTTAAE